MITKNKLWKVIQQQLKDSYKSQDITLEVLKIIKDHTSNESTKEKIRITKPTEIAVLITNAFLSSIAVFISFAFSMMAM